MLKMSYVWVFLMIMLEANGAPSFSSQDETDTYSHFQGSGNKVFEPATTNTALTAASSLPEFMSVLYNCWSKRDNNDDDDKYKQCLESMGEGERVSKIIDSNTVTGFIGDCEFPLLHARRCIKNYY